MVTPVEIINGTMNVTVDEVKDSWFAIIASLSALAVAIVTAIGLYKTNKSTQKSNSFLETDLKSRLRPWVFPTYFGPTYVHLNKKGIDHKIWAESDNPEKPTGVRFGIRIKNNGLLPAKNFQFKTLEISEKQITKEQIEKREYNSSIRDIFPTEETDLDAEMSYDKFSELEEKELWVATMMKYEIDEERSQIIGFIGYLSRGSGRKRAIWSEEIRKTPKSRGRR